MAERLHDLTDVLRAGEADREKSLADAPTEDVLRRTHHALRAARARRAALAIGGAAAAVAVLVAGTVAWSPSTSMLPAGPGTPTPTPRSSAAAVPGLPPLRQATEDEVRGAPQGSALVLWDQSTQRAVDMRRLVPAGYDAYLLLVLPDGQVLQVARAPHGMTHVHDWDRAAGTVLMADLSQDVAQPVVVDVLSGRVVGGLPDGPVDRGMPSPDGTRLAWSQHMDAGAEVRVRTGDVEVGHPLPAERCMFRAWFDDARLLVACLPRDRTPDEPEQPRHQVLLVDAGTGEVTQQRDLTADEGDLSMVTRLSDGRLVLATRVGEAVTGCRTRLAALTPGLELSPLGEVPAEALYDPVLTPSGRLHVAGLPGCRTTSRAGVWSLDPATGAADVVVPAMEEPDEPLGVVGWASGD